VKKQKVLLEELNNREVNRAGFSQSSVPIGGYSSNPLIQ
jgi:hypothetical protein